MNFFQKVDIFGYRPKMYYEKKQMFQTNLGGILAILLFTITVLSTMYYSKDIFYREKPSTIFTEEHIESPEPFEFTKETKTIAIGIATPDSVHFMDESIYTFSMEGISFTPQPDGSILSESNILPTRPCTLNDFQVQGTQQVYEKLGFIDRLYCLDNDKLEPGKAMIGGDWGYGKYSFMRLQFKQCQNTTEVQNCAPQKTIDEYLNNAMWAAYYTDILVEPKEFNQPFKNIATDKYGFTSNQSFNEIVLFFRHTIIESNIGITWDEHDIKQAVTFSYEKDQLLPIQEGNDSFLRMTLRFEKTKQTRINRNYIQIATTLAQVGGIMKISFMVFTVFYYKYSSKYYHDNLIHKLYNFTFRDDIIAKENQEDLQKHIISKQKYLQILKTEESKSLRINTNNQSVIQPSPTQQLSQYNNSNQNITTIQTNTNYEQPQSQYFNKSISQNNQSFQKFQEIEFRKEYTQPNSSLTKQNNQKINSNLTQSQNLSLTNDPTIRKYMANQKYQKNKKPQKLNTDSLYGQIAQKKYNKIQKAEEKTLFQFAKDDLMEILDVTHIIKKLQEMDKLKDLLLDENQKLLFQYIPKQEANMKIVHEKEKEKLQEKRLSKIQKREQIKEKDQIYIQEQIVQINLAYNAFAQIVDKERKSEKDKRIIQLMDDKIFQQFMKFYQENNNNCKDYQQIYLQQQQELLQMEQEALYQQKLDKKEKNLQQKLNKLQTNGTQPKQSFVQLKNSDDYKNCDIQNPTKKSISEEKDNFSKKNELNTQIRTKDFSLNVNSSLAQLKTNQNMFSLSSEPDNQITFTKNFILQNQKEQSQILTIDEDFSNQEQSDYQLKKKKKLENQQTQSQKSKQENSNSTYENYQKDIELLQSNYKISNQNVQNDTNNQNITINDSDSIAPIDQENKNLQDFVNNKQKTIFTNEKQNNL